MANTNIIAIDGPAGAGKGTLTKKLCEHYGFAGLDTGSLYRAITLCMIEMEQNMDDINLEFAIALTQKLSDTHKILNMPKIQKFALNLPINMLHLLQKFPKFVLL